MERKGFYSELLGKKSVKDWMKDLEKGSSLTADVFSRRLGYYCQIRKVTPELMLNWPEIKRYEDLNEFMDQMEDKSNPVTNKPYRVTYIRSIEKAIRSFYRYHHKPITGRIKLRKQNTPRRKKVPEPQELAKILRDATPRNRVAISLMAFSGVRPGVLGNHGGKSGLVLGNLLELKIGKKEIKIQKIPTLIEVPEEISKTGKMYYTFLGQEGCDYLQEYLNKRKINGEDLTPNSPVILPMYKKGEKKGKFITVKTLGADIRRVFKSIGYDGRPYELRKFFSTKLSEAEARGLVTQTYREFWMGHTSSIDSTYNVAGGELPTSTIEEMRSNYKDCEELLGTASILTSKEIADESIRKAFVILQVSERLAQFGKDETYVMDYIQRNNLYRKSKEEIKEMLDQEYPLETSIMSIQGSSNTLEDCIPCKGSGFQNLNTGEIIVCKVCNGSGKWRRPIQ